MFPGYKPQTAVGRWLLGTPETTEQAVGGNESTSTTSADLETGNAIQEEAELLMQLAEEPGADPPTRLHMYKQVQLITSQIAVYICSGQLLTLF